MGWLDDITRAAEKAVSETGEDVDKIIDRWLGLDK